MFKKLVVCLSTAIALATILTFAADSDKSVVKSDTTTQTQQAEAITSGISWWWE
ncbi:TPA: hypothetical protein QCR36_003930 [Bacillus cereus]|uniref:hypothetical protein n=1 Tax=Bacillus TaxID=1386 RepID=UPI0015D6593B|nr:MULTISPECIES: hypothetical protein [Bacillus]MDA1977129.1 hypothetical protein [Bacillus cereus]MDA1616467.1 hypothetical protein [Bacillus cereus group sp. TH204-1LC]MDA1918193.1 hypothetical protein [Bacillus cereus group sp. BcHK140]MEC4620792.1 hypothetical protein [Bacillus paranthracis]HDR4742399.1 hypothetical protein [Bacillus cereus]